MKMRASYKQLLPEASSAGRAKRDHETTSSIIRKALRKYLGVA